MLDSNFIYMYYETGQCNIVVTWEIDKYMNSTAFKLKTYTDKV